MKKELNLFSQGNMSVLLYYNKLKMYEEELLMMRPITSCKCGGSKDCTCNSFKRFTDQMYEDKLIKFLMELDDHYEHIKNQIFLMDQLPSLDKANSMVSKVEKQKKPEIGRFFEIANFSSKSQKVKQDFANCSKQEPNLEESLRKSAKITCFVTTATRLNTPNKDQSFELIGYPY